MFVGLFLVIFATWSYVLVPVLIPVSVSALSDLSALDPVGLSVESKRLCSDDFAAQSAVFACVNESSVFFPNTVNKAPGVAHAAVIICRLTEIKRVHCLRAVMEDYWEQKLMPGRPITLCVTFTHLQQEVKVYYGHYCTSDPFSTNMPYLTDALKFNTL